MSARPTKRARHLRPALPPAAMELIAARFRAMGEPIRLRLLQTLENGEQSVTALTRAVGSTQPNVSKHLKVLQDVGLVGRRQQGNIAYFFIAEPVVFELCEMVCKGMRERLEAQIGFLTGRAGAF